MNLEGITLSEIKHLAKGDKYCMTSLICGIRKEKGRIHGVALPIHNPRQASLACGFNAT